MAVAALLILLVLFLVFFVIFVIDFIRNRKSNHKYHLRESIAAYLFLLPAILLAFFFVVLPIFFSLGYAFTDFDLLKSSETQFIGFENFKVLFEQLKNKGEIYYSLRNTAIFVVLVMPLQIGLALLLALFCNNKRRGTTVFKICFFAPVAISLSVTAFLWLVILSPNENGIMNSILANFGIEAQDFLGNKDTVLWWMVFMSAWQGCGYQMLIFLSALGNIRKDLYEAASIDGANPIRRFFTVTLPGLKPTLVFILITVFIGACRVMIQPMLLTGYQNRSMTLSYYMYQQGFTYRHVGFSCSVALIMTIFMGTITFIQRRLLSDNHKPIPLRKTISKISNSKYGLLFSSVFVIIFTIFAFIIFLVKHVVWLVYFNLIFVFILTLLISVKFLKKCKKSGELLEGRKISDAKI